jgi:hypothetical protein
MFIIEEWCTCSVPRLGDCENWTKPRCDICHKFIEPVEELSRMSNINRDAEGNLTVEERQIIQEKNTTAIVREHDPDMIQRWDNDLKRTKAWDRIQARATSLNLAVSIFNAEPQGYARVVKSLEGAEEETAIDFFGDEVRPLADRVYDYITKDQEE